MPARDPRAPFLLSLVATVAGLAGLVSAITPAWAGNLKVVSDLLSPAAPHVADGLLVASSLGLVLLGRGLARRRHRSWQAALWLLGDLVHRPPAQGARRDRLGRQRRAVRAAVVEAQGLQRRRRPARAAARARGRLLGARRALRLRSRRDLRARRGARACRSRSATRWATSASGSSASTRAATPGRFEHGHDDQPGHGRRSSAPSTSCGSRCGRATAR